jgi:hypothetical protein
MTTLVDLLGHCEGLIEIRPLPPNPQYPAKFFRDPHEADQYARSLDGHIDVYVGVGTRRRERGTKADVRELPGLWCDCDDDASVKELEAFPFEPTIVIETSPGRRQAWWLFKEPLLIEGETTINSVEAVLRGIARELHSDQTVAEVARVMRVPETFNVKRKARSRVIKADGPRYEFTDFLEANIIEYRLTAAGSNGQPAAATEGAIPDGRRNCTLASLAGTMRRRCMTLEAIEAALLAENRRCDPPLPEDKVRKIAASISRYRPAEQPAVTPPRDPDDEAEFQIETWPELPGKAAYYGLAGDIAHAMAPHTEADPVALLLQTVVAFGSCIGRTPYFVAEADCHYTNVNVVLVGPTARGRKGTSWGHVRRLFAAVDDVWTVNRILGGLSSGEGLIWAVRDAIVKKEPIKEKKKILRYEEVVTDPGIDDKRLLFVETEFAAPLRVMERDGNTLSTQIRQAWDSGDIRVVTKNNPAQATGAHISIIGHVTKDELLRYLATTQAVNGFGNRFAWAVVKRSQLLPEGGDLEELDRALVEVRPKLSDAVRHARQTGQMKRDNDARALWAEVYPKISAGKPGLLGAVLSRAEAIVARLSVIYALLDKQKSIGRAHLEAALALWDFCERSARFIFGERLGDPVADQILKALRETPQGLTRRDISSALGRNRKGEEIVAALRVLASSGLAYMVKETSGGRPAERWRAVL